MRKLWGTPLGNTEQNKWKEKEYNGNLENKKESMSFEKGQDALINAIAFRLVCEENSMPFGPRYLFGGTV